MSTEVLKKERNNEIFFEFPVPLSPSFARMDLSDYPALIGAFALGPVCGVLAEFVKNALQRPLAFTSLSPASLIGSL